MTGTRNRRLLAEEDYEILQRSSSPFLQVSQNDDTESISDLGSVISSDYDYDNYSIDNEHSDIESSLSIDNNTDNISNSSSRPGTLGSEYNSEQNSSQSHTQQDDDDANVLQSDIPQLASSIKSEITSSESISNDLLQDNDGNISTSNDLSSGLYPTPTTNRPEFISAHQSDSNGSDSSLVLVTPLVDSGLSSPSSSILRPTVAAMSDIAQSAAFSGPDQGFHNEKNIFNSNSDSFTTFDSFDDSESPNLFLEKIKNYKDVFSFADSSKSKIAYPYSDVVKRYVESKRSLFQPNKPLFNKIKILCFSDSGLSKATQVVLRGFYSYMRTYSKHQVSLYFGAPLPDRVNGNGYSSLPSNFKWYTIKGTEDEFVPVNDVFILLKQSYVSDEKEMLPNATFAMYYFNPIPILKSHVPTSLENQRIFVFNFLNKFKIPTLSLSQALIEPLSRNSETMFITKGFPIINFGSGREWSPHTWNSLFGQQTNLGYMLAALHLYSFDGDSRADENADLENGNFDEPLKGSKNHLLSLVATSKLKHDTLMLKEYVQPIVLSELQMEHPPSKYRKSAFNKSNKRSILNHLWNIFLLVLCALTAYHLFPSSSNVPSNFVEITLVENDLIPSSQSTSAGRFQFNLDENNFKSVSNSYKMHYVALIYRDANDPYYSSTDEPKGFLFDVDEHGNHRFVVPKTERRGMISIQVYAMPAHEIAIYREKSTHFFSPTGTEGVLQIVVAYGRDTNQCLDFPRSDEYKMLIKGCEFTYQYKQPLILYGYPDESSSSGETKSYIIPQDYFPATLDYPKPISTSGIDIDNKRASTKNRLLSKDIYTSYLKNGSKIEAQFISSYIKWKYHADEAFDKFFHGLNFTMKPFSRWAFPTFHSLNDTSHSLKFEGSLLGFNSHIADMVSVAQNRALEIAAFSLNVVDNVVDIIHKSIRSFYSHTKYFIQLSQKQAVNSWNVGSDRFNQMFQKAKKYVQAHTEPADQCKKRCFSSWVNVKSKQRTFLNKKLGQFKDGMKRHIEGLNVKLEVLKQSHV